MRPGQDKIKTIIVDDEPLARDRLRSLLAGHRDVDVVAECTSGRDAVAAITTEKPDLVFLDIQMPEMDGFEVLESIGNQDLPVIVFVTAYDAYAIKAFEVHAMDYLLKPFDRERFEVSLDRARAMIRQGRFGDINRKLMSLLEAAKPAPQQSSVERLVLKSGGRVFFLRVEEIDWIEAAGNYVRLHAGKETHVMRESMNSLEQRLDPTRFIRIHRSTMINIERVKELRPLFHGDYEVTLQDGARVTLSRSYRDRLSDHLKSEL
ncbi:MAG TPA: response regulator [Blastocatellia bacterium]|nr:response regulator [Blastocatellia bacterium]